MYHYSMKSSQPMYTETSPRKKISCENQDCNEEIEYFLISLAYIKWMNMYDVLFTTGVHYKCNKHLYDLEKIKKATHKDKVIQATIQVSESFHSLILYISDLSYAVYLFILHWNNNKMALIIYARNNQYKEPGDPIIALLKRFYSKFKLS